MFWVCEKKYSDLCRDLFSVSYYVHSKAMRMQCSSGAFSICLTSVLTILADFSWLFDPSIVPCYYMLYVISYAMMKITALEATTPKNSPQVQANVRSSIYSCSSTHCFVPVAVSIYKLRVCRNSAFSSSKHRGACKHMVKLRIFFFVIKKLRHFFLSSSSLVVAVVLLLLLLP